MKTPRNIQELTPYKAGESAEITKAKYRLEHVVKLASNENPLGASPRALEAIEEAADYLFLYPDGGLKLRQALAYRHNCSREEVICHAGSDALLHLICRTYLDRDDQILTSHGSFIGIIVAAKTSGNELVTVPQTPDYRYDLPRIAESITERTKIIYLANVNNPTGTYFTGAEFETLMQSVPDTTLVIMDEAYFEYSCAIADDYPNSLDYNFQNVVTLRTFSKIYGLAGARVGYGFAHHEVMAPLLNTKLPFEPNSLGQAAALGALLDGDFVRRSVELNKAQLARMTLELRARGFVVPNSAGNFLMIDCTTTEKAGELYSQLIQRGVIVRPLGGFQLPHCVRISIGTEEENTFLLEKLDEIGSQRK